MKTQKGFTHTFLILGLVFITGFTLSAVFLHNFAKRQQAETSSISAISSPTPTPTITKLEEAKPEETKYKTYTSFSGSGLTFDYPSSWSFDPPTKQSVSRSDSKATIFLLTSEKTSLVNGKPVITSGSMCVTFNEMQGSWPFRSQALSNADHIADFTVGQGKVALVESKSNLASGVNAAMQLLNQDPNSKHGAAYVALKDEYYLLATAQKNCFTNGRPEEGDAAAAAEQARSILKSVRIVN